MKTGITMNPDGTLDQILAAARLAEEFGFHYFYVPDQGFSRDVYVVATLIAQATTRIHFGPGVTHPYSRHPAVTAVAIASLDEASGGRAFLGYGAGGSLSLAPLGLERVSPLNACREAVQIARLLWTGGAVDFEGKQFRLTAAKLRGPCRPDIEVHWASRGPRMSALGGEIADVIMLHGIPRFALGSVISHIRAGSRRAGRTVELQFVTPLAYDDISREAARIRTVYRLVDSTDQVKADLDLSPEVCAEMRTLVTTIGPQAAAHLVSDEVLKEFVLDGGPGDVAELRRLVDDHDLAGLSLEIQHPSLAPFVIPRASELFSKV